jgi:hypothetical protein
MRFDRYKAAPTVSRFIKGNDDVGCIIGPFGSGKSVGCIMKLLRHAVSQKPVMYNGRMTRLCRTLVARNTYQELEDTTQETWDEWLPFDLGKYLTQKKKLTYFWQLQDKTYLHWEVLFRSFDKPKDIRKLKSLEITSAWLNEGKEIPELVVKIVNGRLGRYPPRALVPAVNPMLIIDSNLYDDDHYLYRLFEDEKPQGWTLYKQPSGMSKYAENIENLPEGYYEKMCRGQTQQWIDMFVHAKYTHITDGRPVYPEFNEKVHIAEEDMEPVEGYPLYLGFDWGLTPACVIAQEVAGRWKVLDEIVCFEESADQMGKIVAERLNRDYRGFTAVMTGDPANPRSQSDKMTPILMMQKHGLEVQPAYTNDPMIRRDSVATMMRELAPSGEPAFAVSPKCRMYIKGLRGGYCYRRIQVVGEDRFQDVPDKGSKFSHVCDAGEYAALGAGKGVAIISSKHDEWGSRINTTREKRRREKYR